MVNYKSRNNSPMKTKFDQCVMSCPSAWRQGPTRRSMSANYAASMALTGQASTRRPVLESTQRYYQVSLPSLNYSLIYNY